MADAPSSNTARDLIVIAAVVAAAIFGSQWWQKHHGGTSTQTQAHPPAAVSNFLRELQGADMKAALNPFAIRETVPEKKAAAAAPTPAGHRDKLSSSDRDELDNLINRVGK